MNFQGGYLRGLGASQYTGEAGRLRVAANGLLKQADEASRRASSFKALLAAGGTRTRGQQDSYRQQMNAALAEEQAARNSAKALLARADAMQAKAAASSGDLPEEPATARPQAPAEAVTKPDGRALSTALSSQAASGALSQATGAGAFASLLQSRPLSQSRLSLDSNGKSKVVPILLAVVAVGVIGYVAYRVFGKKKKKKKK